MLKKKIDFGNKEVTVLTDEQLKAVKGGRRRGGNDSGMPGCPPDYED